MNECANSTEASLAAIGGRLLAAEVKIGCAMRELAALMQMFERDVEEFDDFVRDWCRALPESTFNDGLMIRAGDMSTVVGHLRRMTTGLEKDIEEVLS
ncbi:hypothetical protein FJU08_18870 [Martelella alba]|uniref:Uncharacterized protein n=1 Tax=Martelella alba TaxID=2590451 RepID=A0A506U3A6_9HYPH|nr:hypothetical protein [Martelella alba]TPW27796.1 hypothetical protein FJU08_18870 [Martelella alba]